MIDDYSRYFPVYFLKSKDIVFDKIEEFVKEVENEMNEDNEKVPKVKKYSSSNFCSLHSWTKLCGRKKERIDA